MKEVPSPNAEKASEMAEDSAQEAVAGPEEEVTWEDFLSNRPPGRLYRVKGMAIRSTTTNRFDVSFPEITLYCESEACSGERIFEHQASSTYLWDPRGDPLKTRRSRHSPW